MCGQHAPTVRVADMIAVFSYQIEMTKRGCVPRCEIFEKVGVLAGVTLDEMEIEMLWRHAELPGNRGEGTIKNLRSFLFCVCECACIQNLGSVHISRNI